MEGASALEHHSLSRRCAEGLWRLVLTITITTIATTMMIAAASSHNIVAFGYARAMLPGIPSAQPNVASERATPILPTDYYLYVEVASGSNISANWAAVRGQYYSVTLEKVATPVVVEVDAAVPTGQTRTLVPKTERDVYRVVLREKLPTAPTNPQALSLAAQNDVVTSITINQEAAYAITTSLSALPPRAGM